MKTASQLPSTVTRRAMLQGGGALAVGLSLAACVAMPEPSGSPQGRAPKAGPPDALQVDSWLVIHKDNTATLYMGFAELGQGATTALLQIAAEELDLALDQMSAAPLDTHWSVNQGGTYSSASVQRGRPQIAAAAATARMALLNKASAQLNAAVESLTVDRGVVRVGTTKRSITFGQLIADGNLALAVDSKARLKTPAEYRLVAQSTPRADLPDKVLARYEYIQQVRLPNMLHGRVVRPRGQSSYGSGAKPLNVNIASVADISAVQVLRKGDFIGVVAANEWDAVRAAAQLQVEWDETATLPGSNNLHQHMRAQKTTDNVVLERGEVRVASDEAEHTVVQRGLGPYQAHAPFAPNCALADVQTDSALIICSSQDVYAARRSIAGLLGMQQEKLRVQYVAGAGTYGHSCYDDAAQAAAVMSQLAGKPVRVQFMRWDEQGWDTYGPPHVGEARVSADAAGRITAYEYHGWQHNWSLVETSSQLTGAAPATEWPSVGVQGVNPLVCGGMYDIPNLRLVNHRLPALEYLRGAWLRSPLDLSFAFTSEQAIDQLAQAAKVDPLQFRRQNIKDARWRGVLDAVATAAGWDGQTTKEPTAAGPIRRGRGIGLGTHLISYGAAVADIEVDTNTGKVRVLHLFGALDAGLVVNPRIVERQIEGQLVQTASRMLLEEVQFNRTRVTSLDWQSYPILRFADCPAVTPVIVQRLNERSTGAGEETMAAAAAAIANAFYNATGRRMEQYPFTPDRVLTTLRQR
jgi:nicotinate dehydrogenase subunit B